MTAPILPHLPPIMTVAEGAWETRRSNMHVYQLNHDGDLRTVRTSTSQRKKSSRESHVILADDLRDLIEQRRGRREAAS